MYAYIKCAHMHTHTSQACWKPDHTSLSIRRRKRAAAISADRFSQKNQFSAGFFM